jgi:hypothetical protein
MYVMMAFNPCYFQNHKKIQNKKLYNFEKKFKI